MAKRANKSIEKATNKVEKVEIAESFNKIKNTANTVTSKLKETSIDLLEDAKINGKYWVNETSQSVKETLANIDIEKATKKGIKKVKNNTKAVNEFVLETADELVEGSFKNGKKIQSIASKAIQGGLKITAKQQDITFDTLENIKKQLGKNATRFTELFKMN